MFTLDTWQRAFQQVDPSLKLYSAENYPIEQIETLLVWKPVRNDWRNAKKLKRVIWLGAGVDATQTELKVVEGVSQHRLIDAGMREAMCDYAHYAVLHYQRRFDHFLQAQREKRWVTERDYFTKSETPVSILGLGYLGSSISLYLSKMGYPTCGWSRSKKHIKGVQCYEGESQLKDFLLQSKLLINMLPLSMATKHFLNMSRMQQLPQGAAIISLSRGAVIDTKSMLELIDSGYLRGAFMDVFEQEPLPIDSPLWNHPKVIITPHQCAPTQALETAREVVALLAPHMSGK